jgi:hypothetical protein
VVIFLLFLYSVVYSCDVVAISSNAAKNGRPIIWKNRDDPAGAFIGVRKYKADNPEIGTYICIEEKLYPDITSICSAGANEAGFAIANTSAYTGSVMKELINIDEPILEKALNKCKTVQCFEDLLIAAHNNQSKFYVTSSNFVGIDAFGGAAHYEAYADFRNPVEFIKHDANVEGFSNKTNYIDLHEIYDSTSETRSNRAANIFSELYNKNELTPKNVMQLVSKDVCENDAEQPLKNFNTKFCISRAYTRLGIVVEGVEPGTDPAYTTVWVNLGEPSVGVFVPVYPAAEFIPDAVKENYLGSAPFNDAIIKKELNLYSNNGSLNRFIEIPGVKDMTMDKAALKKWQQTTFSIENNLIEADSIIKTQLKDRQVNTSIQETLKVFSKDANNFAYQVYTGRSTVPIRDNVYSFQVWLEEAYKNGISVIRQILGLPI